MNTPEKLALAILRDIHRFPALAGCRSFDELNKHCDANSLGDPCAHAPGGEGEEAVQATCDFIAAAQSLVREVISAAPEDSRLLVTILDDVDVRVWAPPGVCFDLRQYHMNDPEFESTDAAHARLIEQGEHPDFKGFERLY